MSLIINSCSFGLSIQLLLLSASKRGEDESSRTHHLNFISTLVIKNERTFERIIQARGPVHFASFHSRFLILELIFDSYLLSYSFSDLQEKSFPSRVSSVLSAFPSRVYILIIGEDSMLRRVHPKKRSVSWVNSVLRQFLPNGS